MLLSCTGKDPAPAGFVAPVIEEVQTVRGADFSEVIITCRVSSAEGIKEYGVMFGKEELLAVPAENLNDNTFSVSIGGLSYSTNYHYQGYIGSGSARTFSAAGVWTTDDEIPPAPVINKSTPLPGRDAGTVIFTLAIPGWDYVTQKEAIRCGICYSQENDEPTLTDFKAEAPSITEDGEAGLQLENLVQMASYHFRAYSQLGTQVSYSKTVTVYIPSSAAVVVTLDAQSVTATSALLCGAVSTEWMSQVSRYGFYLGENQRFPASNIDSDGFFSVEINPNSQSNYTFRAFAVINNETFYGEPMSFSTPEIVYPDEEYVDLGLDVLWATRNLGAVKTYDSGQFFAWGETENRSFSDPFNPYTGFYKWGMDGQMTKYNKEDGLTELEPSDDAVTVKLGSPWRTPRKKDWEDLLTYCEWTRFSDNNSGLFKVTSKKAGFTDKCIYILESFPDESVLPVYVPAYIFYMSSNLYTYDAEHVYPTLVWILLFPNLDLTSGPRNEVYCIRPVRDKNPSQTNQ